MTRDRRLLIPFGLFLASFAALAIQAVIVAHYIYSSVLDSNWESFIAIYGVEPPVGPNQLCFDYCAPKLPFLAGWLGIGAFLGGLISLAYVWLKPRS